jgi:P4 family phage/plasmid primase-like protien
MSFNKFLQNKKYVTGETNNLENRNSDDYFFNKSDLHKMEHFRDLIGSYKLCNKVYYYFHPGTKLWIEEKTDDSVLSRICERTQHILNPENEYVLKLLNQKLETLNKKSKEDRTDKDKQDIQELETAIKDFTKFINKEIKEHMKVKFAKSVINFFHHNIIDNEFTDKININNQHLLPFRRANLNLKTFKMNERIKEQYFTKCLDFDDLDDVTSEEYKIVDNFFLDIATGNHAKKDYLQKILGYFLTGNVNLGRCFFIFYGEGKNGKSAVFELLFSIMKDFIKPMESSVFVKRGLKNSGAASPEIEGLDYGTRLAPLSETAEGDELNETLLKNITGGDDISYRPLYGKNKNFKSEAKLCMLTNNKPFFKLSQSMVDRLRFIEFKSRFIIPYGEGPLNYNEYIQDTELVQLLKTDYKRFVLAWMVMGSRQFFEDGHMNIPEDAELQKENLSYINSMDSVQRFIDECLVIEDDASESAKQVNDLFKKFCIDEKIPIIKPSDFKTAMMNKFKKSKSSNNKYYGFKIKREEESDDEEENPLNV